MKDLTQGPIPKQLVALALPMAFGMLLQTLYIFVDLYFVAKLGDAAIAGVAAASNLMFVSFLLTQMLAAGTVALVSHAAGRKDRAEANHVFNQAVGMAAILTVVTLVGGYAVIDPYTRFFAPDEATREAGATFLKWFLPNLVLQFPIAVMGSALRGTGIVKPGMLVQALTVVLNTILAPILVAGWGTGVPLGVMGAGLASSISVAVGVVVLAVYFVKLEHYVGFDASHWRPQLATWRRIADIGLPAGGEFGLMAIFAGIMYYASRGFGAEAQAGVGIGFRINQMLLLPVLALGFAAAPLAGQNYGARKFERVRETFRVAVTYSVSFMLLITAVLQWKAEWFARIFTTDQAVIDFAVLFLTYLSWNFPATGITQTSSSLFQAIGNTWPALGASAVRVVIFAIPAVWMTHQPWFKLQHVLALSVATVAVQAVVSYAWLKLEFRKRLG